MQYQSMRELPAAADLFGDLEPAPKASWRDYVPGLAVAGLAALAAAYLSDHYGAPLTLMALLVGLAMNFLSADARLAPGLAYASRTLLRFGIVLVGLRITLGEVASLGPEALAAVIVIVAATLASGALFGRWFGNGAAYGTLAGGAVAICGASAALAIAAVLGERRANQAQLALVLVGISAMSSLALFLYPLLGHALGMTDRQAGFMIGASIHDVAQALGGGYAFSPEAGETAAIVKLTRVALLAPALAAVAWFFPSDAAKSKTGVGIPWFVVGFFVLAGINSTGLVPAIATDAAAVGASALLAWAVTATGMRSPMNTLLGHGFRPFLVIVASTVVALLLSLIAAFLLGK